MTDPTPRLRYVALVGLCAAIVLLIPFDAWVAGGACWAVSLVLALRDPDPAARRRLSVLLGVVALLAFAPIHTDTGTSHFLSLGVFFAAVVVGPALLLHRSDRGVITWAFWPPRFRWADIVYVLISAPIAWGVFHFYFFQINPDLPTHWPLPAEPTAESRWRLIVGINCVGIWDELFFINTIYAILRSIYPRRVANAAQAVLYTSVLYTMAFTGIGPILVYLFALTQGAMYDGSRSLLYVLIVHLIVDLFLVAAILQYYYPGTFPLGF